MKYASVVTSGAAAIRAASAAAAAASVTSTSTSATAHGGKKMDSPQPSAHKRKIEDCPQFPDQPKKKMKAGIFNPTVMMINYLIYFICLHIFSWRGLGVCVVNTIQCLHTDQGGSERNKERKTDERGKEGKKSDYSRMERKADMPVPPAHAMERKGSDRGEKSTRKEKEEKNLRGEQSQKNEKEKKKGDRRVSEETKVKKSRPFTNLMEDVVFVLSGYQNPERSQLRDAMLDMGATYKSDWGPTCTHLM